MMDERICRLQMVPRVLRGGAFWNDHQGVRVRLRHRLVARNVLERRWLSRRGAPMTLISDPLDSVLWGSPEGA